MLRNRALSPCVFLQIWSKMLLKGNENKGKKRQEKTARKENNRAKTKKIRGS